MVKPKKRETDGNFENYKAFDSSKFHFNCESSDKLSEN